MLPLWEPPAERNDSVRDSRSGSEKRVWGSYLDSRSTKISSRMPVARGPYVQKGGGGGGLVPGEYAGERGQLGGKICPY